MPRKTNCLMRRARISSGGVRSRSFFFGTAREDRFGTRDVYYGVAGCPTHCRGGRIGCDDLSPLRRRHACRYVTSVLPAPPAHGANQSPPLMPAEPENTE